MHMQGHISFRTDFQKMLHFVVVFSAIKVLRCCQVDGERLAKWLTEDGQQF